MISVSIISHGHSKMLPALIEAVLGFSQVSKVILTLNIPESFEFDDERVVLIRNVQPKGFGSNNNAAFALCDTEYFCIVNPDIMFSQNPFPALIPVLNNAQVGVVAPMVIHPNGKVEDNARHFTSLSSIFKRHAFRYNDGYQFKASDGPLIVQWVAGMFMLFHSAIYQKIGGFDDQYFLYVEDTDICTRLWLDGFRVLLVPASVVIHDTRRQTLKNLRHLRWHVASLFRYFFKYLGRLPKAG